MNSKEDLCYKVIGVFLEVEFTSVVRTIRTLWDLLGCPNLLFSEFGVSTVSKVCGKLLEDMGIEMASRPEDRE